MNRTKAAFFRFSAEFGTGSDADFGNIPEEFQSAGLRPVAPFPSARKLNILQVEDNIINRQVLRRMLKRAGHDVIDVDNGQEAVNAVVAQDFDIILMDRPYAGNERSGSHPIDPAYAAADIEDPYPSASPPVPSSRSWKPVLTPAWTRS